MECSRCGSQNLKTFEMAHASYNIGINAWNRFLKLALFGLPGLFMKPSQNTVARRTSPPDKPIPVFALVFVFVFLLALTWLIAVYIREGFEDPETQTAFVVNGVGFVVATIVAIWDVNRAIRARRVYAERLDDWIHSWICLQCGTTYKLPDPRVPTQSPNRSLTQLNA